ncbi:hypothetical protein GCM10020220_063470 [Nonomuraea rubra]
MSSDSALRRALARARDGKTLDVTEATVLLHARDGHLDTLLEHASRVRDAGLRAAGREGDHHVQQEGVHPVDPAVPGPLWLLHVRDGAAQAARAVPEP